MRAPDEEVAERIIGEFKKAKLLSEEGISKIVKKLASGKMTAEEWRLIFETDIGNERRKNVSKG